MARERCSITGFRRQITDDRNSSFKNLDQDRGRLSESFSIFAMHAPNAYRLHCFTAICNSIAGAAPSCRRCNTRIEEAHAPRS